jgi:carboxylesterase
MQQNEFQYMFRGQNIGAMDAKDARLLQPIAIIGEQKKRALLLLHGFSSSPAVYRRMIPHFTMYDAIVCPTLPGHGDSIKAFSMTHATDWQNAATKACQALIDEYAAVDVMGLSLGGLLACRLSTQFRINHLFLLAPALALCLPLTPTLYFAKIAYALGLRQIPNRAGNIYTKGFAELSYSRLPVHAILEILTLIKTFQWIPPSCPVDLFLGRHDEVVDSNTVAARFQTLPNTHIHWLEQSAHVLPLDGDMEKIIHCMSHVTA